MSANYTLRGVRLPSFNLSKIGTLLYGNRDDEEKERIGKKKKKIALARYRGRNLWSLVNDKNLFKLNYEDYISLFIFPFF